MAKVAVALKGTYMAKKHDYQDLHARQLLSELLGTNQWKGSLVDESGFEYDNLHGSRALEIWLQDNMDAGIWDKWKALPRPVYDSYLRGFYRGCNESAVQHGLFDDSAIKRAAKNKEARHKADKILEDDAPEIISSQEAHDMAENHKGKLLPGSQYSYAASFSHDVASGFAYGHLGDRHSRWTKIIASEDSEKVKNMLVPLGMSPVAFGIEQIEALQNCTRSHRADIEKRVGVGAIAMFSEVETVFHKEAGPSGARVERAMQCAAKETPNVYNDQEEYPVAGGPVAFAEKVKRKRDDGQTVNHINLDNICCFCPQVGRYSCIVPLASEDPSKSVDHWCGDEHCKEKFTAVYANVTKTKNHFTRKFYTKTGLSLARKRVCFDFPKDDSDCI